MKAILLNSAVKLPFWHKGRLTPDDDHEVPLDYVQGAGMVNAMRAHQLLTAGPGSPGDVSTQGWDLNRVDANQAPQVYRFAVAEPANRVVTVTLVWNRHYGRKYPFERIVSRDSDLRLEVWAIDAQNANNNVLLDYSDSPVDNVEHIRVELLAEYTLYEVAISHSNAEGRQTTAASERYAVAWSMEEKAADENILWHDLNADGIVNEQDFSILMNNLVTGLKSPEAYVIGDINMDGSIDGEDLGQLREYRNRTAPWRTETVTN